MDFIQYLLFKDQLFIVFQSIQEEDLLDLIVQLDLFQYESYVVN